MIFFYRFILRLLFEKLSKVTKDLLEINQQRIFYIQTLRSGFELLSNFFNGSALYYLTIQEIKDLNESTKMKSFTTALRRQQIHLKDQTDLDEIPYTRSNDKTPIILEGLCVTNGRIKGSVIVVEKPISDIITKISNHDILVAKNIQSNFAWLPLLRLFKGIILEASGFLDAGILFFSSFKAIF